MVDFFWKRIQAPLLGAIIAASIYNKLATFYKNNKNTDHQVLYRLGRDFEDKANKVSFIGETGIKRTRT